MQFSKFNLIKGDKAIWSIVLIFSILSILAVYSSSGSLVYRNHKSFTEYYVLRHLSIVIFGLLLMYFTHLIKYKYYAVIAKIGLMIAIPLLAITLLFGANLNDASRWLVIPGTSISFQTSDFAKLFLIMYLARTLAMNQENIKDLKKGFLPVILPVIFVCVLILPANLSTAAIIFLTCTILIFIGRVSLKYIAALLGIGAVAFIFILMIGKTMPQVFPRFSTWVNRIENFRKPGDADETFQTDQAKMAIANGGILGNLPGKSEQKNYLPHPYSDFIFAVIIEEYGLVGGIGVVFLYLVLLYRCIRIVTKSPGSFGAFLTIGIGISLILQAIINMGVAVGLLPVTGQTLPFISMGGTSILFTGIAIGIILSVSRETELELIPQKI